MKAFKGYAGGVAVTEADGMDSACPAVTEEQYAKVLSRLQALCVRKECCASEMMDKALKALDGDRYSAEKMLASLREDKFVDDERYAVAFAREKSSLTGWGARKIEYGLLAKGVDRAAIAGALENIDNDGAESRLRKLLETKYRTLREDPACKLKLLRYAMGRGYSYDEVRDIVDDLIKE